MFELGLAALKHIPSASPSYKRHVSFGDGPFFCSLRVRLCRLCLLRRRSHKVSSLVWRLKTPLKKHSPRPLSLFCHLPLRSLSHQLASCACGVTYAPLPPGSTPSVLPRDRGPVVASLKRLGEKFAASLALKRRRKKARPSGRRGSTWS